MFTSIQKVLPKAIVKLGIKREAVAALVCEKYRRLAPRFIHTNALFHTFPKYYRGKTLTVGVENPAWGERLISCKEELIREINVSLGHEAVNNIVVKTVAQPGRI